MPLLVRTRDDKAAGAIAKGGLGNHLVLEYGQFLTDMDYAYA